MEETSITIKPILWRLIIWKSIPLFISFAISILLTKLIYKSIPFFWQGYAVGLFAGVVIICLILYYSKQFDINISKDKISGPSSGYAVRKTFSITDFDKSSSNKQTRLDKIVIGQILQSLNGEKIIFASFIYNNLDVKKFEEYSRKINILAR